MSEPAPDKLPAALRALLIEVRKGLQKKGDDGSQGGARASVPVKMGWAEVRAIYALHTALGAARTARDAWQKKAAKGARVLEATEAQTRADFEQLDLLNNRAIVSLLVDIERILSGNNDDDGHDIPDAQIHATLGRVKDLIKRANKKDKRRRL